MSNIQPRWDKIYEGGATTYSDTNLDPATEYTYRVTATNQDGDSPPSATASATTSFDAPASFTATPQATKIDLAWSAVAKAAGYKLQRLVADWEANLRTSGFGTSQINAIATDGKGTWMVVGVSSKAAISTDHGANWTIKNVGVSSTIQSIATDGKGLWILVGNTGKAAISTDNAANWTLKDVGFGTTNINAIATDGKGMWMIAGVSGTAAISTDNTANWTLKNVGAGTSNINSIATDGKGTWMLVGAGGMASVSTDNAANWTAKDVGFATTNIYSIVTDGKGLWMLAGNTGKAATSTDNGTNWTLKDVEFGTTQINAVATDGKGTWMVGGNTGKAAISMDNAANWTVKGTGFGSSVAIQGIATDGKGLWIFAGVSGTISAATTTETIYDGPNLSYSDTGLTPETFYSYQLSAYTTDMAFSEYLTASGTTLADALTTAPALTTGTVTTSSILFNWTAVAGADSYRLERQNGSNWEEIYSGTALTYTNTGLTAGTEYSYRAFAVNSAGDSPASTAVTKRTLCAAPAVTATGKNQTTDIEISWAAVDGATSYVVESSTTSGGTYTALTTVTAPTAKHTHSVGSVNTERFYRVKAVNASGDSAYSSVAGAKTAPAPATAPSGGVITESTQSSMKVSWVNPAGTTVTQHLVEYKKKTDGTWPTPPAPINGNATSAVITGLAPDTEYDIRISLNNVAV